jgi:hypothetical protein
MRRTLETLLLSLRLLLKYTVLLPRERLLKLLPIALVRGLAVGVLLLHAVQKLLELHLLPQELHLPQFLQLASISNIDFHPGNATGSHELKRLLFALCLADGHILIRRYRATNPAHAHGGPLEHMAVSSMCGI